MATWQPIETAPRDGTAIWLLIDGHPYLGYCDPADWLNKQDSWVAKSTFVRRGSPQDRRDRAQTDDIYGTYARDVEPTHWQSLPEALMPSEGAENS